MGCLGPEPGRQGRQQKFPDERRLARAANARHAHEAAQGDFDAKVLEGVARGVGKAQSWASLGLPSRRQFDLLAPAQILTGQRASGLQELRVGSLEYDFSACRTVAGAEVNIDMIVQNVSAELTGRTDITFTLPKSEGDRAMAALAARQDDIGFESLKYDAGIGKISLVGAGMRSHPGVSATFFRALADADVNVELISTSEIRISVVCRESAVNAAVEAVHTAFGLDAESGEAVIYGGTGR